MASEIQIQNNHYKFFFDILDTTLSFTFGLLMGIYVFLNKIINYSSDKLFIVWDYAMQKTNRKQIVKDMDNDVFAVNYFILFPKNFNLYFNLVVCKINTTNGLDNNQFKNIITYEQKVFTNWYFLLLNHNMCITNKDKTKVATHKPGFYIKSSTVCEKDNEDMIVINKPVWGLVLHYDLKNKKN